MPAAASPKGQGMPLLPGLRVGDFLQLVSPLENVLGKGAKPDLHRTRSPQFPRGEGRSRLMATPGSASGPLGLRYCPPAAAGTLLFPSEAYLQPTSPLELFGTFCNRNFALTASKSWSLPLWLDSTPCEASMGTSRGILEPGQSLQCAEGETEAASDRHNFSTHQDPKLWP